MSIIGLWESFLKKQKDSGNLWILHDPETMNAIIYFEHILKKDQLQG